MMGRPATMAMTTITPEPAGGVLPVDKPVGPTSHDAVAMARRALRTRRIGHTGTLDPFASGLLLLCVDRATRIAEYLTGMDKRYSATIRLGETTDTDDLTGALLAAADASAVGQDAVERALEPLRGALLQLPPRYSAKQRGGERAYVAARQGRELALDPVPVHVHELRLLSFELPLLHVEVHCSSGTYIRALARDLGEALGVGAHLVALRRTAIGPHALEGALSLDGLGDADAVAGAMMTSLDALRHLPRVELDDEAAAAVRHGRRIAAPTDIAAHGTRSVAGAGPIVLAAGGALLGIAELCDGMLQPRKVLQ
jgi:tRNA pseudouridine55 synthase